MGSNMFNDFKVKSNMKLAINNREAVTKKREGISALLKQRRNDLKLTTTKLGDKIGINNSSVTKIEKGEWNFGIETLIAFCDAMDLEIEIKPKKKIK